MGWRLHVDFPANFERLEPRGIHSEAQVGDYQKQMERPLGLLVPEAVLVPHAANCSGEPESLRDAPAGSMRHAWNRDAFAFGGNPGLAHDALLAPFDPRTTCPRAATSPGLLA